MKKAIDIAKISAKGSAALSLGMIISNGIMAVGTFLVAGFLNISEYGLYAIVLVIPTIFGLFQDLGVNSALIKYTAQYRSEDKKNEIKKILATALLFDAALGIFLSLTAFLLAGFFAVEIFHRPEIKSWIEIATSSILFTSMIIATQSVFVGFEKMEYNSLTMILQAVLRAFAAPILVRLGYGVFGAVVGLVIAAMATMIFGIVLFILYFYRKLETEINDFKREFKETLILMLSYGFPLSISAILTGFQTQFYNFLVAFYLLDNDPIANYQMALNFMILLGFLSTPIIVVLFPAFSKLNAEQDKETLKRIFQLSVKYGSLLVVPAAVAIMVLSEPIIGTLFGRKFGSAPFYLSLSAIQGLYSGIGNLSIHGLINGQGKTRVTLKLTLSTLSVGIPLSLVLIPTFKIIGLIATILIAVIPTLVAGSWYIKKYFDASIDTITEAKIYLSSAVAGVVTFYTLAVFTGSPFWIRLVIGGSFFVIVYLVTVSLMKTIDENDLSNLREMLRDIGPALKILNPVFKVIETLSRR